MKETQNHHHHNANFFSRQCNGVFHTAFIKCICIYIGIIYSNGPNPKQQKVLHGAIHSPPSPTNTHSHTPTPTPIPSYPRTHSQAHMHPRVRTCTHPHTHRAQVYFKTSLSATMKYLNFPSQKLYCPGTKRQAKNPWGQNVFPFTAVSLQQGKMVQANHADMNLICAKHSSLFFH